MRLPVLSTTVNRTRYVRGFRFDGAAQVIVCAPAAERFGHRVEGSRRLDGARHVHRHRRRLPEAERDARLVPEPVAVRADRRQQIVVAGERRAAVVGMQVVQLRRLRVDPQPRGCEHARAIDEPDAVRAVLDAAPPDPAVPADRERATARRRNDPAHRLSIRRDELNAELPFEREVRRHTQRRSRRREVLRNDRQRRRLCVSGDDECRRDRESQPAHRGRVAAGQDCRVVWVRLRVTLFPSCRLSRHRPRTSRPATSLRRSKRSRTG